MDTNKSTLLSAFKSKKPINSPAPSDQKIGKVYVPDSNPLFVKTPGKQVDSPRRSQRRRTSVMSINEIRQAALKLREHGSDQPARPDPIIESDKEPVPRSKKSANKEIIKLPEKFELLEEFFNSLDSSIRLLSIKNYATIFTHISSQIRTLTGRSFLHSHLAQLKFIMPEVIVLEKILQHDERTSCMKPDLLITLDMESIKRVRKSESQNKNLQLRKVFRDRLLDFIKSHPECDEVPEEALPEPFNRSKENVMFNSVRASASSLITETPNVVLPHGKIAMASHLSPSFRKRFSKLGNGNHTLNLQKEPSDIPVPASVDIKPKFARNPFKKEASPLAAKSSSKLSLNPSRNEKFPSSLLQTPVKPVNFNKDEDLSSTGTPSILGTPVENTFTPSKLMSATPMIHPTKRCYISPDDKPSGSPSKLLKRPPPSRTLIFNTPVKKVEFDDDIFDTALLESIREKERKAAMENDPAISQAKRRQQIIASLPKFFDMVYYLFNSIRRSVITKEELIHKIISGNSHIVDRREVEEHLRLLQELVPEWIHEKSALSGDVLLCVNKISSPEAIRTRLFETK
ncbi:hypothetical protein ACJIZ3_011833 [Penstemon smallii]|uniref:CDT1 Geminin-binding domain-containing protein n=1 Tax=Penstemon smallii TaxID=265156 RepID=A0ABD3UK84_9LAMI